MRALPHLAESVHVEGSQGATVPVFGAGTPLPAVRRYTLPGPQSQQVGLDLHVLHGSASQTESLGHWRISGAEPSDRRTSHLRIQFIVDAAGGLEVVALQDKRQLTITPPAQEARRLPVDPAGIEPASLASAWSQLRSGEDLQVREQVATFLQAEPDSLAGWALLAALVDEPLRKADCYRQVLRLDPGNLAAWAALQAIPPEEASPARPAPRALPLPSLRQDGALICPRCGAVMELREGESQGRQAFCPGCGATIELPETFEVPHHGQTLAGHEGQRPLRRGPDLEDEDAIVADLVKSHLPQRSGSAAAQEGGLFSRLARRFGREPAPDTAPATRFGPAGPDPLATPGRDPLDPDLVLQLAGGPLTAEERIQCPECGAAVSRDQETCPWCSASLAPQDRSE
jgi:predicted RNA-binding Zn-ribbon protein involved in translation (DUF1610 family)